MQERHRVGVRERALGLVQLLIIVFSFFIVLVVVLVIFVFEVHICLLSLFLVLFEHRVQLHGLFVPVPSARGARPSSADPAVLCFLGPISRICRKQDHAIVDTPTLQAQVDREWS